MIYSVERKGRGSLLLSGCWGVQAREISLFAFKGEYSKGRKIRGGDFPLQRGEDSPLLRLVLAAGRTNAKNLPSGESKTFNKYWTGVLIIKRRNQINEQE